MTCRQQNQRALRESLATKVCVPFGANNFYLNYATCVPPSLSLLLFLCVSHVILNSSTAALVLIGCCSHAIIFPPN